MDEHHDVQAIKAALAAPFDPCEVRFWPAAVSGHRALALAYIDVRTVQDRLDQVLGVSGWQDEYEVLPGGGVVCRLKVLLEGQWLVKSDVGGSGELPAESDKQKAAFTQALKRAAVKWGVGRYLYRLPELWVDYDPARGQIVTPPRLPSWAMPQPAPPGHISKGQERHLLQLLSLKGYSSRRLTERYGVEELGQLSVEQYRHAADHLARLPDHVES